MNSVVVGSWILLEDEYGLALNAVTHLVVIFRAFCIRLLYRLLHQILRLDLCGFKSVVALIHLLMPVGCLLWILGLALLVLLVLWWLKLVCCVIFGLNHLLLLDLGVIVLYGLAYLLLLLLLNLGIIIRCLQSVNFILHLLRAI